MASRKTAARLEQVLGQPSWRLASDRVKAYVTQAGGHIGPVTFKLGRRSIEPLSVAPWAKEKIGPKQPPIIQVLRGDFFCLPFGGNSVPFKNERHPVHGETANRKWKLESLDTDQGRTCMHLSMQTRIRPGRVDKKLCLMRGQPSIYSQHIVSGMSGPMDFGHHAMVRFPDEPASGIISTSRFVYGQVFPGQLEDPEIGGYSALKGGAEFTSLDSVPTANGQVADLTRYPARRGFEDLVMIVSDPDLPLAWSAVTFPKQRYLWLAVKDPKVLRSTIFWLSNAGRHYAPWSGRHRNVLGIEEVTANFHYGLAESAADNPLVRRGIPTVAELNPARPLVVNYIMVVAEIPSGFDRVISVAPASAGGVTVQSASGQSIAVPIDLDFLRSE